MQGPCADEQSTPTGPGSGLNVIDRRIRGMKGNRLRKVGCRLRHVE